MLGAISATFTPGIVSFVGDSVEIDGGDRGIEEPTPARSSRVMHRNGRILSCRWCCKGERNEKLVGRSLESGPLRNSFLPF